MAETKTVDGWRFTRRRKCFGHYRFSPSTRSGRWLMMMMICHCYSWLPLRLSSAAAAQGDTEPVSWVSPTTLLFLMMMRILTWLWFWPRNPTTTIYAHDHNIIIIIVAIKYLIYSSTVSLLLNASPPLSVSIIHSFVFGSSSRREFYLLMLYLCE